MTDHLGFLADILDHPDDDTPRLIYADWLEDHGEPERAEFIRAHVRLGEIRPGSPRRTPAIDRVQLAWLALRGPVLSEIPYPSDGGFLVEVDGLADQAAPKVVVRRGFVETVYCPLATWEAHGPAIVSRHPVRRVEVTDLSYASDNGVHWRWVTSRTPRVPLRDLKATAPRLVARLTPLPQRASTSEEQEKLAVSRELLAWARDEARRRGLWPGVPATAEG